MLESEPCQDETRRDDGTGRDAGLAHHVGAVHVSVSLVCLLSLGVWRIHRLHVRQSRSRMRLFLFPAGRPKVSTLDVRFDLPS